MSQALVPLWGSKNEVVAPKWRTQNTFFGAVLEFILKFAILVLNIKHKNGFFAEHFAIKANGEEVLGDILTEFGH